MTYQEAVETITNLPKFFTGEPLFNTKAVMAELGHPDEAMRLIHVAGTNGKGSVCAYIASILSTAGRHTGLYTSPHLMDIRERFQMDGEQVSRELFTESFQTVQAAAQRLLERKTANFSMLSQYEVLFLMGLWMFRKCGMEFAVIETGMGGRLDATNAIRHPEVTVLTSISLDHTEYLGDTYAKIAAEKAGIIKAGCPVVYDGTRGDVEAVILKKASEMGSRAYGIRPDMYKILRNTQKTIDFSMDTGYYLTMDISISTVAEYQVMNAMEAVTAVWLLEAGLTEEDIRCGMKAMRWQGRMETVFPGVILDGAHNDSGVEEFVKTARKFDKDTKVTILFSCVKEKDYEGMIRTVCEGISFESVIVTEVESERRVSAETLEKLFRKYTDKPVEAVSAVQEAFERALSKKGDGILFCVGSLYLAGSVKSMIRSGEYA